MIEANVLYEQGLIRSFTLSGHAESGPYGYDLVCAAVSAVAFGSVNAVLELADTDLSIEQGKDGGFLSIALEGNLTAPSEETAQLLFAGMVVSLETIERDYAKFLCIRKQEGG